MLSASRKVWARLPRPGLPAVPWATRVDLALVALLTLCVGQSTVAARWVPGADSVTGVAMAGMVVMAALALLKPVRGRVALPLGVVAGAVLSWLWFQPELTGGTAFAPLQLARFPDWVNHEATSPGGLDTGFFILLLAALMWLTGGWLAWCVLRRHQPMLGLVPAAAVFATTILNFPGDQNGYLLVFLLGVPALLMWQHYHRSLADADRRHVRLSGDSRWDFWEAGVVATAVLVVAGIFLPPLSRSDQTVDIQNGVFRGWAELQQRLNHAVPMNNGVSEGNSTGFATDVSLSGPLERSGGLVFTYTVTPGFAGQRYFRGVDLVSTKAGEWHYSAGSAGPSGTTPALVIGKDTTVPYFESYVAQDTGSVTVNMLKPPARAPDVIFYPGQIISVDRVVLTHTSVGMQAPPDRVLTVDRLSQLKGQANGPYTVHVQFSTATETQLQAAGTAYPAFIQFYRNYSGSDDPAAAGTVGVAGYRDPSVQARIRELALKVTAGTDNPYDAARAIENYLRTNYTYTLKPPRPPAGVDPIDSFLFRDKQGYCEYFATAMGDMLRALGIPVRLVNGYGPGTFDDATNRYVVKESDAHTWVEVYFPTYGFIPFEPTADGVYFPIARGGATGGCTTDACDKGAAGASASTPASPPAQRGLDPGSTDQAAGGGIQGSLGSLPLLPMVAGLMLVLAGAFLALSRFLRPATAGAAWRRTRFLARLGGVSERAGETPMEFARRLGRTAPGTGAAALRLGDAYSAAAYAPPALAAASRDKVLAAYQELRPVLISRIRYRRAS